jgi:hypothetical protein
VVLRGKVGNTRLDNRKQHKLPLEEIIRLREYEVRADFYIDGALVRTMELPIWWMKRSSELFFEYELPPGKHTLRVAIPEKPREVYMEIAGLLVYGKEELNPEHDK